MPGFVLAGEPKKAINGHCLKMLMQMKYEVRLSTWVGALFLSAVLRGGGNDILYFIQE